MSGHRVQAQYTAYLVQAGKGTEGEGFKRRA